MITNLQPCPIFFIPDPDTETYQLSVGWFRYGKDKDIEELGIVSCDFWLATKNYLKDVYLKFS